MSNINKNLNPIIELLRWVGIVAVIIHHIPLDSHFNLVTIAQITLLKSYLGWAVCLFFFLSGIVASDTSKTNYISHRAKRLLTPYLVVSLINITLIAAINKIGIYKTSDTISWKTFLYDLISLKGYGPQYYYLPYLLVVSIAYKIIKLYFSTLTVWLCLSSIITIQCIFTPFDNAYGHEPKLLSLYLASFMFGTQFDPLANIRDKKWLLLFIPILLILSQSYEILHLFIPPILYQGLSSIKILSRINISSKTTGTIYLWHAPIILPALVVISSKAINARYPNYLGDYIVVILSVAVSIFACQTIHKLFKGSIFKNQLTL